MKLIPEEISYLRKELRRLKDSQDRYYEYMKSRDFKPAAGSEINAVGDALIEEAFQRDFANYRCIIETLNNSEYVKSPTTDKIEIGTKFIVSYNGEEDEEVLVLTEGGFGCLTDNTMVSTESPLGKVVLGKQKGDTFEFSLNENVRLSLKKRTIKGEIKEIKTDPTQYLHFIRDKKYATRISRHNKNERTKLSNSIDQEDKEKLLQWDEISLSQKELLEIEIKRLSKLPKTPENISRLAYITKLNKKSKIATPSTDDTIGIGTRFEIMTTDGENITTNSFEMINRAISDELEDEYVERISPLGEKIYGLKQNEEFEFVKDRVKYKGIVTRVEQPENQNTMGYQYKI